MLDQPLDNLDAIPMDVLALLNEMAMEEGYNSVADVIPDFREDNDGEVPTVGDFIQYLYEGGDGDVIET